MAKGDVVQLFATATQAAADGFIQVAVNTGVVVSGKEGLLVKDIVWELAGVTYSLSTNSSFELALSRVSKAAMPAINDNDVMLKLKRYSSIITSGAVGQEGAGVIVPAFEIKIVESVIYVLFDTQGLGAVQTAYVRIDCEVAPVSDSERIAILQNSLN